MISTNMSGWWFHPIPKIPVRLDHHSECSFPIYGKIEVMFQTTNQMYKLHTPAAENCRLVRVRPQIAQNLQGPGLCSEGVTYGKPRKLIE